MICTTREQSERLLKCGIPEDCADMFYNEVGQAIAFPFMAVNKSYNRETIYPAWSLSALFDLSPKEFLAEKDDEELCQWFFCPNGDKWQISYGQEDYSYIDCVAESKIEACIQMFERLYQNGYLKNKTKR